MKKKIFAIMLCIAMLAIAVVGGTLAYFTDDDSVKNTFTVGSVEIEQNEYKYDGSAFVSGGTLLPMGGSPAWADKQVTVAGDTFKVFDSENVMEKVVTVSNTGSSDAYVRTIVALEAGKDANTASSLWYNNIGVTDNSDGETVLVEDNDLFVQIGENYYIIVVYTYADAVAAGYESVPSLTGVALYNNTTQEDAAVFGGEYDVLVLSQAVQVADMGDDAGAALDKAFGDVDAANVADWFAAAGF